MTENESFYKELLTVAEFVPIKTEFPDAWIGHIPFASWLIRTVKPNIFVELGTHSGNSYFAFCQSVQELNLPTKCYAVDTWFGDEHAGRYDESVFSDVNAFNQAHFSDFSRLLRMKFDDAVEHFADASIDLLHIDGLHTYEAVKHDFETWLPKMAPNALVLFHDTNVRERNFGVWRLFKELKKEYPDNIEFFHSNGLGIVQIGRIGETKIPPWLIPDSSFQQQIKDYFQALGERQQERYSIQLLHTQIASLNQTIAERDAQIANLNQTLTERDSQIKHILSSRSWKITRPLRIIKKMLLYLKSEEWFKKNTVNFLTYIKKNHHILPLNYQTKRNIYRRLCMISPSICGFTAAQPTTIDTLRKSFVNGTVIDHDKNTYDHSFLADNPQIMTSNDPIVSVIIPVYGELNYTLRCLHSISAHMSTTPFEVIVVDDCSPGNTFTILSEIKGIRLLRNEQNQGFIRTCNSGAKIAYGEYLYFLNNDTEVTAGWMDELLRTFHEFPGTGLAGSKLVYPDGRLQEAGGIIWQDGSAWNFGRFEDPLLPIYNYAREVDYCSGASIMVPKVLFDELGGFDEHYLPAYCEDSDLALKIRDKGYRVIYQPLSTVIHFEGITSGTDVSRGTKAYQTENANKLFVRWQHRLTAHQIPGTEVDAAKDRTAKRRVLVIDHCTPTPNKDAGSVTAFNLMMLLREMDFQVTFIPEDNFLYMPEYTTALQRTGIEALYAPYVTSVKQHIKECGKRYDLALLIRPDVVERHLKMIRKYCPNAKVLFETADLHYLRMYREAELYKDITKKRTADEMKKREFSAIKTVDYTIIRSTAEMGFLRPLLPKAKLHVFPLIMTIYGSRETYCKRRDIVFVGNYQHTPNVDAVKYFVEEVMPLLRKKIPGVRFYAVGSKPPEEIKGLAAEDIIITGFIEDLTSLLDKMRVSVAPLRYGAGIKGKIGIAMAVGLPVVATSLAAEGMSLTDGENILVADGAEALADTLARIYHNETLWNCISKNGLAFAEQTWGAEAAWGILAAILADMGIEAKRGAHPLSLYSASPAKSCPAPHFVSHLIS